MIRTFHVLAQCGATVTYETSKKKKKTLSYLYEVALVVYAQNYVDVLLRQWNYIERAEEFTRPHNDFPFIFLSIFLRLLGVLLAVCAVLCCSVMHPDGCWQ